MICKNTIIKDGLLVNFDLTNIESWDGNEDFTIKSITKWDESITTNIELLDYGLTQFDIGETDKMWDSKSLNIVDDKLSLKRIGYNVVNNPSNIETTGTTITTHYDDYNITGITNSISGNHFKLDGGYLTNFFKLEGYDYQLLPNRFRNGVTFETILDIWDNSNGIFLYMGIRSEDKYNPYFEGEFSGKDNPNGVHTSEVNFLDSYSEKMELLSSFKKPEEMKELVYLDIEQLENIKQNQIAFYLTDDKRFGYKYINEYGNIISNESDYVHQTTGFTSISIVYEPNITIPKNAEIKCFKRRIGDLDFYVNGALIWNVSDFPEFYFRKIKNTKEKQIGVPYNLSWGGGTFGLRHSYHYDNQTYMLYYWDNDNSNINDFERVGCNIIPKNTNEFIVEPTGHTSQFEIHKTNLVTILPNREYIIRANIEINDLFKSTGKVSLITTSNETDICVFNETIFNYDKSIGNNQINIELKMAIDDNVGPKNIQVGILFESDDVLNENGIAVVKDFQYVGSDILVVDDRKSNLVIEENFSNSYIGGIQKLRIYDRALSLDEIQRNGIYEMSIREDNQINISRGGRIICG